jgi:hypothetical protein
LPIHTVYDPEHFLTTSTAILKEWLVDYIIDVDITDEMPFLNEQTGITRPILYLQLMPGSDKSSFGIVMSNTTRGKIYKIEFLANWIVSYSVGGTLKAKELGESLYYSFLEKTRVGALSAAKLRNVKCSTYREIPKGSTEFFGGRHLISFEVEVYYTG